MSKINWKNSRFVRSCLREEDFPRLVDGRGRPLPEIAIVGRSNVGKSSLLNDLFSAKLAKTSSTPGKTQLLNFFVVDDRVALVDLPGYGYARAPREMKATWGSALQEYHERRIHLFLILWLLDIRREPSVDDKKFFEWAAYRQKPLLVVATKIDTLAPHEVQKQRRALQAAFLLEEPHPLGYSAKTHEGKIELQISIQEFLNGK